MTLGEKIKMLRERKGISMSKLSRMADMTQPTIWRLERGIILQPKTGVLQKLAQALGVSTDFLLSEDEDMSFDELLSRDPVGQAVFRSYEQLTSQGREQVRSFVGWLIQQEKQKGEDSPGEPQ